MATEQFATAAEAWGKLVVDEKVKDPIVKFNFAFCLWRCGKHLGAVEVCTAGLHDDHMQVSLKQRLLSIRGQCLARLGRFAEAADDLQRAISYASEGLDKPKRWTYMICAISHAKIGQLDRALEFIDMVGDTNADIHVARGWCLDITGDMRGAVECYTRAISMGMDEPKIWKLRASCYTKLGNIDAAAADMSTAVGREKIKNNSANSNSGWFTM